MPSRNPRHRPRRPRDSRSNPAFLADMVTHTVGNTIATLYKLARKRWRRNNRVERRGGAAPMADTAAPSGNAKFGEAPLGQTVVAAAAMRRLGSLLLSLEHAHPAVDDMIAKFTEWESALSAVAPRDSAPRIGEMPDDHRRIYLNHATDIGAYNPCFPAYRFDHLDAGKA